MDMKGYETMAFSYTCLGCKEVFTSRKVWIAREYFEVVCTRCDARTRFVYSEDLRGTKPELVIPKAENPEAIEGEIKWIIQ